jgi:arsenite methyltransferase
VDYVGSFAELQQAASRTQEYGARRAATLSVLEARTGEAILDVGCGSGLFLRELAEIVGPSGRACGIDLSEQLLQAARVNCAGHPHVELQAASALALPYPSATFDAVVSIQVLEYIDDPRNALKEMHRTLRPGGRLVNFATLWHGLFWNSREPARMQQVLRAWDAHAPFPNLPAVLSALLLQSGFEEVKQSPIPMLNTTYDTNAFSYWLSRVIAAFVVQQQLVPEQVVEAWLQDLADVQDRNEFMFCSTAIISYAKRSRD